MLPLLCEINKHPHLVSACLPPIRLVFLLIYCAILAIPVRSFADFYKYNDDSGVVNVTNDFSAVPERFRAGITVVKDSELEKKVRIREKQVVNERVRGEKQSTHKFYGLSSQAHQESPPATKANSALDIATTPVSEKSGRKSGWLGRQLPFIKVSGTILALLTGTVVLVKMLTALLPRVLGTVVRIAFFIGVAIYVFSMFSERISNAFIVMKSETDAIQKSAEKRAERIEKQAVER